MQSVNEIIEEGSNGKQSKRVIIVGDSILNGINEKGFKKETHCKGAPSP